ncbi:MAG: helix-turn-helix domain-containing protein [Verrucomicrobia bacterium]|nr:MAG: helix-turn-helix domain-containing protein [Verrucomicrobiota bacterium]
MENIGQQLKAARERKSVTASQAAAATHLKVQHVEALERDDYSRLAVPTYAKGFLKIYAEYLGLDPAPLLREYTLRHAPVPTVPSAPEPGASRALSAGRSFQFPQFSLPPLPTISPELLRRVALGTGAIIVVLLLVMAVRQGCHRAAPAPTMPPAVHVAPAQPTVATPTHTKPAPWIIVNEPPPPYYQRPATPATMP